MSSLQDERFDIFLLLGSFGPTLAALITAGLCGGRAKVKALLRRLVRVRVDWRVYLFVLAVFPAFGILIHLIFGIRTNIPLWQILLTLLPLGPLNALFGGIIFGYGPLGEEMGWRGILENDLQAQFRPVFNTLVVGVTWSFWHLPLFRFEDFRVGLPLPVFIFSYTVSIILIAYTMGHIWRWSRGSLFLAIFFHAVVNTTTTRLTDAGWWQLEQLNTLQLYWTVIAAFAATAVAAALVSRTIFRSVPVHTEAAVSSISSSRSS
jgi:uncharacterized protein